MRIAISPYSRKLHNGKKNFKNYPYWEQVIRLAQEEGHELVQVGNVGEEVLAGIMEVYFGKSMRELTEITLSVDIFLSVDTFYNHMCHYLHKPGICIFSLSDPEIAGYPENINLLKDKKYLRPNQFDHWENTTYNEEAFVSPEVVMNAITEMEVRLYGNKTRS